LRVETKSYANISDLGWEEQFFLCWKCSKRDRDHLWKWSHKICFSENLSTGPDDFHSATAKTVDEACKLVEVGFEYVCEFDGIKVFRKRA